MQVQAGLLVRSAAQWFGPTTALTAVSGAQPTNTQTFEEMNRSANRLGSGLLALGTRRDDRVGVLTYNVAEVVHAWVGMEKHDWCAPSCTLISAWTTTCGR